MFNKQLKANIKDLDLQISKLGKEIAETEDPNTTEIKVMRLEELTKVRCLLAESKVKESNAPIIISGVIYGVVVLAVLKHEKTDVITSKAMGIALSLFKGA